MPLRYEKLLLLGALAVSSLACKPKIGDDCKISTDCSAAGDRLCDITAPGGYCTVYNCEPGTCPAGEGLCVEFGAQRANVAGVDACTDTQSPSPYARSFCMATCDDTSDCRGGYVCADLSNLQNPWGAVLIDRNRGNKACVVPFTGSSAAESAGGAASDFGDVCKAALPAPEAAGGQAAASSEAGQGGQSGQGGNGG